MKYPFRKISVMWRSSRGESRVSIGHITVSGNGNISFLYDKEGLQEAKRKSPEFSGYPGIPFSESPIEDSDYLKSLFALRLINLEREDRKELLDFWLLDDNLASDPIMLLAMTQGMSMSDMFEFVPSFQRESKNKQAFITDIAGLTITKYDISALKSGDRLQFEKEPDNIKDPFAIIVLYDGNPIGWIKRGHNYLFKGRKNGIKLTVHKVVNNAVYPKLYVKVVY